MHGESSADRDADRARIGGGPLPALAAIAVLADAATTAAFLAADLAEEANGLLVAGLERGLAGGALVFLATQGALLALAWLALGAVSTYVAVYLVVTMGVGGGLNNAVLLATGTSLFGPLGPTWSYLAPPVAATVVGLAAVRWRHDGPRWLPVLALAAALLAGEAVSLVA